MEQEKISRINALAKKAKTQSLTASEQAEQKQLREEYIAEYRANLKAQLDNTIVIDNTGKSHRLHQKK